MSGLTVYYVVGQPRSGSTFVGDWVARQLGLVNAGEVWQTFRSVGLVHEPGFETGSGRWARPDQRAAKNAQIEADPFWGQVLQDAGTGDPYTALITQAQQRSTGLVDCSKTDRGIARYKALGCEVVVLHSIRAFTSWSLSMRKYQERQGLPQAGRARLLLSYLRNNARLRRRWGQHSYRAVMQERLDRLDTMLSFDQGAYGPPDGYLRAEMFGTPGFTGQFDPSRATQGITLIDRMCYAALRLTPPKG